MFSSLSIATTDTPSNNSIKIHVIESVELEVCMIGLPAGTTCTRSGSFPSFSGDRRGLSLFLSIFLRMSFTFDIGATHLESDSNLMFWTNDVLDIDPGMQCICRQTLIWSL